MWTNAIENQTHTSGNLVCINHFQENDYEIKYNKYHLKKNAVPKIFEISTNINDSIVAPEVTIQNQNSQKVQSQCMECLNLEKEIQILRKYVASLESQNETTLEELKSSTEMQQKLAQQLNEIRQDVKEMEMQLSSDLVRFAVSDDPKVNHFN